jgi:outer membrane protein OmpA-like peptidoglycan-associated protein
MFRKIQFLSKRLFFTAFLAFFCLISGNVSANMVPPSVMQIKNLNRISAITNDDFLLNLGNEYRSFAIYEQDYMNDPADADIFAQKAISAYQGVKVLPENPRNWDIPLEYQVEIYNGYDDMTRLFRQGVTQLYPRLSAEAQGKFDCWVEQQEENVQPTHIAKCKNRFLNAIGLIMDKMNRGEGLERETSVEVVEEETYEESYARGLEIPEWDTDRMVKSDPPKDSATPMVVNNIYPCVNCEEGSPTRGNSTAVGQPDYSDNGNLKAQIEALKEELKHLKKNPVGNTGSTIDVEDEEFVPPPEINDLNAEIYFDWDEAGIESEWKDPLRQIAQILKENPRIKVKVEGHADTSGPRAYNFDLSKRRADNVISYLRKHGAYPNQIEMIAKGETDLKVPTEDGIKHPENRRVKIVQW